MLEIPSELFREILSRVPAEPLLRFRCVSKAWRDAIDDPIFIKSHLDRQLLDTQDSSNGTGRLILRGDLDNRLYSLSLASLNSGNGKFVKATPLNHSPISGETKFPVGSCNGVMLVSLSKGNNFLWNPLTRGVRKLPPPLKVAAAAKKSRGLYLSVSGFGYDSDGDDYKVVKIAQVFDPRDRSFSSEASVYSLKLDSWRRIKDFPYRISRLSGGVFLRGALHWISSSVPLKCLDDLIIGLDIGSEDYCLLPLPPGLCASEKPSVKSLGALGGCLILSCYYQIERLDVWLMKEYGVGSSWIKLFSIGALDNVGAVETLRPIAYSECKGHVLLQHDKKEFLWFDIQTKLGEKVGIRGCPATFSSQFCLSSLVRLNVSVGNGGCHDEERSAGGKRDIVS